MIQVVTVTPGPLQIAFLGSIHVEEAKAIQERQSGYLDSGQQLSPLIFRKLTILTVQVLAQWFPFMRGLRGRRGCRNKRFAWDYKRTVRIDPMNKDFGIK